MMLFTKINKLKFYKSINYCQLRYLLSADGKWVSFSSESENLDPEMPELPLIDILKKIESQWKSVINDYWKDALKDGKAKKSRYILSMFPYPSGSLHLGHIRIYTTSDVLTRLSYLRQHSVVHPIGFDSFGLPAENAALLNSIDPSEWTKKNINQMARQLNSAGYQFNWRESTSDPSYYKWTQWLFLELYKAGLVYRGMGFVNWDPLDCTVLADEQVDEEGRSWRSGAIVEKKCHRQWFVKTNSFANDLYKGTDINTKLGHWDTIILHQRHWIGQPTGYLFYLNHNDDVLPIFTSFPELFAHEKAFIAINEHHWLVKTKQIPSSIKNPFTNKPMQVIIMNDQQLPDSTKATVLIRREGYEDVAARENVLNMSKELKIGGYFTSSKYRDWLVSRQRYWGTPIPMVHCKNCGIQPVSDQDLPIKLPVISDWKSLSSFKSDGIITPIQKLASEEWLHTKCPKCGQDALRDTETLDTFFDSSWYFLRFATEPLDNKPFDRERVTPTWCYVGGKEHSALHLFYARFITHFLYNQNKIDFREPFSSLLMQSIVKGKTYKVNGKYISAEEASKYQNVVVEYEKMSKSKGNGVDPDVLINKYGCDATRWCILSEGSPDSEKLWKDEESELSPTLTFLRRVWLTIEEFLEAKHRQKHDDHIKPKYTKVKFQKLNENKIREAIEDLNVTRNKSIYLMLINLESTYQIRNGVVGLHNLVSCLRRYARTNVSLTQEYEHSLASLIIMMSPLTPHFSAECWYCFASIAHGHSDQYDINKSILYQKFPEIDYSLIESFAKKLEQKLELNL